MVETRGNPQLAPELWNCPHREVGNRGRPGLGRRVGRARETPASAQLSELGIKLWGLRKGKGRAGSDLVCGAEHVRAPP